MLIGQFLVGLFFVFMAIYNYMNRNHMMETVKASGIAVPSWALGVLVLLEGLGGLMVMFNFYRMVGAIYLIAFTVVVSYLLHPFWKHKGREMWKHLWVVMGNVGIIGGLLLAISAMH
jgi:uncharacterized membrane protein YphA (DoxX/SURF4 family)